MRKALIVTGMTIVLAPAAVVAGYFGMQAYLDWLIAGARRPLVGVTQPPRLAGGRPPLELETHGPDA